MAKLLPVILFAIVVGIESFSIVKDGNSIIDVTIECGANLTANNPVLSILTDVDISAVAKCKNGEKRFTSTDLVHYTLPATLTSRDNLCELNEKDGSDNFDIDVEVHYGELDSLILTRTKVVTVVCTYSGFGQDDSAQHSILEGPQAHVEIQSIVGGTVPAGDVNLRIQTVDDQDAVGSIAFDRRYSLFASYTGTVQNVGMKPVSCDAVSDDGERYAVLVAGCGDGFIFDRSDGFITTGTTFRSPYFFAFHLANSGNLAFNCNVTLCSPSCDGSSCETVCGTVTSFVIPNIQLDECSGEKYQDTCTFICNDGYTKTGAAVSTCGADGIWTVPDIACPPKDCGSALPQGIQSTGQALSGTTYPTLASYTCNEGYSQVSGSPQIHCLANGQWDADNVLNCDPIDCGPDLPEGTQSSSRPLNGTVYLSLAQYTCNEGYVPYVGANIIRCWETGQWDTDVLNCEPKSCGPDLPVGIQSSGTPLNGTVYLSIAQYTCNEGYSQVSGSLQIQCLATGQWDADNVLNCEPLDCGPVLPDGMQSTGQALSGTTYPNVASYTCNEGYSQVSGTLQIQCLATGKWDADNVLNCETTVPDDIAGPEDSFEEDFFEEDMMGDDCSEGELLLYRYDCTLYDICVDGYWIYSNCRDGEGYDRFAGCMPIDSVERCQNDET